MHHDLLSIEEASENTGLATEDIEYAELNGLVSSGREKEGYFTQAQIKSLKGVAALRNLGLTMDDIRDLELSEDILAEIDEYLGFPRRGRPSLDLSTAYLRASVSVLQSHERIIENQIEQLEIVRRNLARRTGAFRKLLSMLEIRQQAA